MSFLDDYEPVEVRLARFWADHHTDGQVFTELVERTETEVMFRCEIWTDRLIATGYAHERVAAKGVNSTSHVENCETSAIGRALANAGYAPKGQRPSAEEMAKVRAHADHVKSLAQMVKNLGLADEVRALDLAWPWSADDCLKVEALVSP